MRLLSSFYLILILAAATLISSCGGSSDTGESDPDPDPVQLPGKASAILPANGEPCSEFSEIAGEPDKALITFQWNKAENATSYRLRIFEEGLQITSFTSEETRAEIILDRGKTYSWTVISGNNDGETVSETFSFTSPGIPIGNFAPYAAEITLIFDTQNLVMNLSWVGKDEDGDSLLYNVEIKENGNIVATYSALNIIQLPPLNYVPGNSYEVSITCIDSSGNTSVSVIAEEAPE